MPYGNPPVPYGWRLMDDAAVTPAMSAWAVGLQADEAGLPMFWTVERNFDAAAVLARAEWHGPSARRPDVHRGVTLYVPADSGYVSDAQPAEAGSSNSAGLALLAGLAAIGALLASIFRGRR